MPVVQGTDNFAHGNFTVPGGGPYMDVLGGVATDYSIIRPGDPASLLLTTGDARVGSPYTAPPTRAWRGFAWRLNAADEPGSNILMSTMWTAGFGSAAKLYWVVGTNELAHTIDDATFANFAAPLSAFNWIEQIFDVSTTTSAIYTRVNGFDLTPVTKAGSISTVNYTYLGQGAGTPHRFSHHMWGIASSITDWLGETTAGYPNTSPIPMHGWGSA